MITVIKMVKRVIVYVLGILILGLGVIFNTKTALGVAAINSVPYSLSQLTNLTLGNWTTVMYIVMVVIQLCIYRKFELKVIMQIPFSYVMGIILDFYDVMITFVPSNMIESCVLMIIAILLTGLGVYLVVGMDFVPNPPDGLVNALAHVFKKPFGSVKWIFDCCMMSLTIVMTLLMTGHIIGIGIGTVISALFVGRSIQMYTKVLDQYKNKIYQNHTRTLPSSIGGR